MLEPRILIFLPDVGRPQMIVRFCSLYGPLKKCPNCVVRFVAFFGSGGQWEMSKGFVQADTSLFFSANDFIPLPAVGASRVLVLVRQPRLHLERQSESLC